MRRLVPAVLGAALLAVGSCSTTAPGSTAPGASGSSPPGAEDAPSPASSSGDPRPSGVDPAPGPTAAPAPDPGPVAAALALAPEGAAYLTVTDWARIRQRLGASGLTGESIQTDRSEFWRSVGPSTVLLTDGALRAENSRLGLRYGLTQDDVVWEVRWASGGSEQEAPWSGPGLALRLRDDLDLAGLGRAVADGVAGVEGAQVLPEAHLLLRGAGEPGSTLASEPDLTPALDEGAETQLVVPGCLGWPSALGVDAGIEDQEGVASATAVEDLRDPAAWGVSFVGREATVTVVHPEGTGTAEAERDARARLGLAEVWPTTESVGWRDAFGLPPGLTGDGFEVEQDGGRVVVTASYRVVNPTAAATVALAGLVPWAVCSEIDWLAEPTGL